MYLISACLIGENCKYNGKNNFNKKAMKLMMTGDAIAICPEINGGLSTPRIPAEIRYINGERRVVNKNGEDVTKHFEEGARKTLEVCLEEGVTKAILQPRSPSCGVGQVYSGEFNGELVNGYGFTAQLLRENGIEVISIDDWENEKEEV